MLKMGLLFNLFLFCFLGLTGAGQETIELLDLYDTTPEVLQAQSYSGRPIAVSVRDEDLNGVSDSILKAENWLRSHVLAHFPSTNITTIVVGNVFLCQNGQDHNLGRVLPSLKNIYHSLTRWGLQREIKVSAAFSSNCFQPHSPLFRDDFAEQITKTLLEFLHSTNSTYCISLPKNYFPLTDETASLVFSHSEFVKRLGSFVPNKINVILNNPKQQKPLNRKLSTINSKIVSPFPTRPTPLPDASQPPLHSSIGFSVPANIVKNSLPPLAHTAMPPLSFPHASPPPLSFPHAAPPPLSFPHAAPPPLSFPHAAPPPLSFPHAAPPPLSFPHASPPPMATPVAPEQPSFTVPASAPYGYSLPPCNPAETTAPAPNIGVVQKLWCVAKPSVPAETLQAAMDYACGGGGGDCEEIKPNGTCYHPDTVVAHASYAFNSYWQRTKRHGGTCSFGGTAMIINSDPSFLHCQFVLS